MEYIQDKNNDMSLMTQQNLYNSILLYENIDQQIDLNELNTNLYNEGFYKYILNKGPFLDIKSINLKYKEYLQDSQKYSQKYSQIYVDPNELLINNNNYIIDLKNNKLIRVNDNGIIIESIESIYGIDNAIIMRNGFKFRLSDKKFYDPIDNEYVNYIILDKHKYKYKGSRFIKNRNGYITHFYNKPLNQIINIGNKNIQEIQNNIKKGLLLYKKYNNEEDKQNNVFELRYVHKRDLFNYIQNRTEYENDIFYNNYILNYGHDKKIIVRYDNPSIFDIYKMKRNKIKNDQGQSIDNPNDYKYLYQMDNKIKYITPYINKCIKERYLDLPSKHIFIPYIKDIDYNLKIPTFKEYIKGDVYIVDDSYFVNYLTNYKNDDNKYLFDNDHEKNKNIVRKIIYELKIMFNKNEKFILEEGNTFENKILNTEYKRIRGLTPEEVNETLTKMYNKLNELDELNNNEEGGGEEEEEEEGEEGLDESYKQKNKTLDLKDYINLENNEIDKFEIDKLDISNYERIRQKNKYKELKLKYLTDNFVKYDKYDEYDRDLKKCSKDNVSFTQEDILKYSTNFRCLDIINFVKEPKLKGIINYIYSKYKHKKDIIKYKNFGLSGEDTFKINKFELLPHFMPEWYFNMLKINIDNPVEIHNDINIKNDNNTILEEAFKHRQLILGEASITMNLRKCSLFFRGDPWPTLEPKIPNISYTVDINKSIIPCILSNKIKNDNVFLMRIILDFDPDNESLKLYEYYDLNKNKDIFIGVFLIKTIGKRYKKDTIYFNTYIYYSYKKQKLVYLNFRGNRIYPGTIFENIRVLYLELNLLMYYHQDINNDKKSQFYYYRYNNTNTFFVSQFKNVNEIKEKYIHKNYNILFKNENEFNAELNKLEQYEIYKDENKFIRFKKKVPLWLNKQKQILKRIPEWQQNLQRSQSLWSSQHIPKLQILEEKHGLQSFKSPSWRSQKSQGLQHIPGTQRSQKIRRSQGTQKSQKSQNSQKSQRSQSQFWRSQQYGGKNINKKDKFQIKIDLKNDNIQYDWNIKFNNFNYNFDENIFPKSKLNLWMNDNNITINKLKEDYYIMSKLVNPLHYIYNPLIYRSSQKYKLSNMYDNIIHILKNNKGLIYKIIYKNEKYLTNSILAYKFNYSMNTQIIQILNKYHLFKNDILVLSKNIIILDSIYYLNKYYYKNINNDNIVFILYKHPRKRKNFYNDTFIFTKKKKIKTIVVDKPFNNKTINNIKGKIKKFKLIILDIILYIKGLIHNRTNYNLQFIIPQFIIALQKLEKGGTIILYTTNITNKLSFNFLLFISTFFNEFFICDQYHFVEYNFYIFKDFKDNVKEEELLKLMELNRQTHECDPSGGFNYKVVEKNIYNKDNIQDNNESQCYLNSIFNIKGADLIYRKYKSYMNKVYDYQLNYNNKILELYNNYNDPVYINELLTNNLLYSMAYAKDVGLKLVDWLDPNKFNILYYDKKIQNLYKYISAKISLISYTSKKQIKYNDKSNSESVSGGENNKLYKKGENNNKLKSKLELTYKLEKYKPIDNLTIQNEDTYMYFEKEDTNLFKKIKIDINRYQKQLQQQLYKEYGININKQPVNRAWIKAYELFTKIDFFKNLTPQSNKNGDNTINAFYFCEAPGNIINSALYYIKNYKNIDNINWNAQSLNNADIFDDYGFIEKTKDKWDFGKDDTGDITIYDNFLYYLEKYKGVDMVVSDCGTLAEEANEQKIYKNLGTCQLLYDLLLPRKGGNFIMKTGMVNVDLQYLSLLYICYMKYEKLYLFKSSRNFWSNEIYIVGIGFKGLNQNEENILMSMYEKLTQGEHVYPIKNIPKTFYDIYIKNINKFLQPHLSIKRFFVYLIRNEKKLKQFNNNIKGLVDKQNEKWLKEYMANIQKP
jgi:hypothetical protein